MSDEYEEAVKRRSAAFVIVVIIITLGFLLVLPDIRIHMDFKNFLPENEVVSAKSEMKEYFGEENEYFYILVEPAEGSTNVLSPEALREQYNVSIELMWYEKVKAVYGLAIIMNDLMEENSNLSILEASDDTINLALDIFRSLLTGKITAENYSADEYEAVTGILLSKDFDPQTMPLHAENTVMLVLLDPELDGEELKKLSTDIRDDLDNFDVEKIQMSYTGNYLVASDIDEIGNGNIIMLGVTIIFLVTIVLAYTFRKISYVILPLVTLAIAIIWTLGTMALLGIKFTIIDVAVIPLLLGLGVDYTVHTSRRYLSELDSTESSAIAMAMAQRHIVPAIFLAVLTTSIAFLSNQLSTIRPVRDFGLVCAIGIFYSFILTLIFHNTSRFLIDSRIFSRKKEAERGTHEDTKMVKIAVGTATKSVKFLPVLAIIVVGLITALALVGAVNVRTEFSETDFLPEEWESIKTSNKLYNRFEAGRYSEVFIFIRDDLSIPQNIAEVQMLMQIQEFESRLSDNKHVVKINRTPGVVSILFYVQKILRDNNTLRTTYDSDADLMPDDSDDVLALYDYLWEYDDVVDPLTGQTYSERIKKLLHKNDQGYYDAMKINIPVKAETTAEIQKMYDELKGDLPDFLDTSIVITGNMIMTLVTTEALQSSQIDSTILAVILAFILLVIIFRSIGLGLISLVPVVLSTIWILGTMYLFGISLNMLTVMVTALTIGLGLDYAIYIVTRYKEERKTRDVQDAIDVTIRGTGSALIISGVTTVSGFAVLMLSPIPIIFHFGLIISMTILYCGVLAVVVLPILLSIWEKTQLRRKDKKDIVSE